MIKVGAVFAVGAALCRPPEREDKTKRQLPRRRNARLSPENYVETEQVIHVTICTQENAPLFASEDVASVVKQKILDLSRMKDVRIYAYVIMPDHIHLLVSLGMWSVPGGYVRNIKGDLASSLRGRFGLRSVWQKGFYDHVIRKCEDLNRTAEYILNNPVRKGMVDNWKDYPWSGSDVFEFD